MINRESAASMSLSRSLMSRFSLPTGFIVRSHCRASRHSRGRALETLPLVSSSWGLGFLPPPPSASFPSILKPPVIPGFRMAASGLSGPSGSSAVSVGTTPEDVLSFWFKGVGPEIGVYSRREWFMGGPAFDEECEKNFGETLKLASTGGLNEWMLTARGRLALVIILDQISRNVYRGSASAYAQDAAALKVTKDTIEKGLDKELAPSKRHFLYLPLMHSEDLNDHELVDELFEQLVKDNTDNEKLHEFLITVLDFERKHSGVLKKFGRYPSRNADLGRTNTKEEEEYLAGGGGW